MKEITKMDVAGIEHMIREEGLVLNPYLDTKGIPTIAVGNTYYENGKKVKMTDPAMTREAAISLFRKVLKTYELTVYSTTRDDITQNEFNALVSICYNIGVNGFKGSTFLNRINARASTDRIVAAIMMWTKDKELIPRRKREAALWAKW